MQNKTSLHYPTHQTQQLTHTKSTTLWKFAITQTHMKIRTILSTTPIHQHQNLQCSKNKKPNSPYSNLHTIISNESAIHCNPDIISTDFNRFSMAISHSRFAIRRAWTATHALRIAQKLARAHFSVVLLFLDNFSTNSPVFFIYNIKVDFLVGGTVLAVFSCKWASAVSLDVGFFMFRTNCLKIIRFIEDHNEKYVFICFIEPL